MQIRISLVHYLNAAPLGWAFLRGGMRREFAVIPASPANCAEQLSRGDVDIGLIPSIEFQRIPNLQIIPGISIASLRRVRSLLLIKPKGMQTVRSVALDSNSRTTVALAKILLREKMGMHPEFVSCPPDPASMLARCDAALLIGDPALQVNPQDYDTTDLVESWVQWQQKPFVCAFWACRKGLQLPGNLQDVFMEARGWGLRHFSEIAAEYARSLNLPAAFLEHYLAHNIDFSLGPEHLDGLGRFYRLAKRLELIPELRPLEFVS